MTTSAMGGLLSAILLGAMLAASAPVAADQVTDSSITSWVNEALRHDPLVPASEISVSTKEGIVTLSGRVDNLAAKNRADRQASKIRGVREVLNELTVAPSPLSDADIVYAVRRRILNNATIVSQGIVVTSVDGNVTIKGEVANWSEAEEAALLASAVGGVKNVKNELVTRYTATRSDQEIKNDAVAALHRDVYLTGFPITRCRQGRRRVAHGIGRQRLPEAPRGSGGSLGLPRHVRQERARGQAGGEGRAPRESGRTSRTTHWRRPSGKSSRRTSGWTPRRSRLGLPMAK